MSHQDSKGPAHQVYMCRITP
uniref:Uncharacterized protein n=1 Tax=Arundo donax TaxID=35708 RepID=A0A0A9CC63_ARUDO